MGVTQSYNSQEDDGLSLSKPIPIQTPSSFHTASLLDKRGPMTSPTIAPEHFVPVVFRWTGRGRKVFLETWPLDESGPVLSGTTNRVEMQFSHTERDFATTLKLPPGKYKYHFEVDGVWRHAEDQPFFVDGMHISNTIIVLQKDPIKSPRANITKETPKPDVLSSSPPGKYGANIEEDLSIVCGMRLPFVALILTGLKQPTKLPPHLERALLNCRPIGNDPDQLPVPHRVMINHIYEQPTPSDDVVILGLTRRYKEKFVTTVYYKNVLR